MWYQQREKLIANSLKQLRRKERGEIVGDDEDEDDDNIIDDNETFFNPNNLENDNNDNEDNEGNDDELELESFVTDSTLRKRLPKSSKVSIGPSFHPSNVTVGTGDPSSSSLDIRSSSCKTFIQTLSQSICGSDPNLLRF